MSHQTRCPGCGLIVDEIDGPTHDYMISSPACFHRYAEILSREYADRAFWSVHRLTVDTYAAQHPGTDDPRARQSVSVHLVSLHLMLEREASNETCIAALRRLTSRPKGSYPRLLPTPATYPLTVVDPYRATSAEEYRDTVRRWARATWEAWSGHHETVRALADSIW